MENEVEIRLSRPCVEDPSRFIAECNIGRRIDIAKLCDLLRSTGAKELKCSVKLGVARFEMGERSVMIYRSGRVDIRRIRTRVEAQSVLEQIMNLAKDTIIDISS